MTDPNCIFCKIASGQIPSACVFQDETAFAFLDIGPLAEGHVLLIPREHYQTLDQMPPDVAGRLLGRLPALVKAAAEAAGAEGVNVLQNNGKAASQEVPHVHFHVIPRRAGDAFRFNWPASKYPPGRMEELAKAIREKL